MSDELVVVARFLRAPEAHMAKAKLDDEGIQAVTTDELSAGLFSAGIEKIELMVRESDADRAREIFGGDPPGGEAVGP